MTKLEAMKRERTRCANRLRAAEAGDPTALDTLSTKSAQEQIENLRDDLNALEEAISELLALRKRSYNLQSLRT